MCAWHGQLVSKIPYYSRGCKSLTGKLVKPVSKPQGGNREVYTEGSGTAIPIAISTVLTNRNGIQRLGQKGEQAHLCDARDQQFCPGRYRRNRGKEFALTRRTERI